MTTATVVLFETPGAELVLTEVTLGDLEPGEVRIRVAGVGICHTDLAAINGVVPLPLPAVVGHEAAGVVEEIGTEVTELAPGDHVVVSFDSCRTCTQCSAGHPAYCELFAALNYFGTRLDGSTTMHRGDTPVHGNWFGQSSFGTHAVVSARNAVKVDPALPLETLGPLGCSLQTGAGTVLNVLNPVAGQSIAVFGIGAVGLSAVMAAKAVGCEPIIVVDPNPTRLTLALELGATHTINPNDTDDVAWTVSDICSGGVDFSIDAVGIGSVVRQALQVLRSPGICATLGLQGLENDVLIDQGHLLIGRTLTGVIEGDADPHNFIPQLVELWRQGRFPFEKLTRKYPLARIHEAIAAAADGSVIKPIVVCSREYEVD